LDELVDGHGYVCSSTLSFCQIDYRKIHNPSWTSQYKASIKGLGEIGSVEADDNIKGMKPRIIVVFRAGPRPRTHVKALLNRRSARSFQQVLSDIGDQVRETGPIKSIYSLSGQQVHVVHLSKSIIIFNSKCIIIS